MSDLKNTTALPPGLRADKINGRINQRAVPYDFELTNEEKVWLLNIKIVFALL